MYLFVTLCYSFLVQNTDYKKFVAGYIGAITSACSIAVSGCVCVERDSISCVHYQIIVVNSPTQGLKLCFGKDLKNPVMWLDIFHSIVQKPSKCVQKVARNGQKIADV